MSPYGNNPDIPRALIEDYASQINDSLKNNFDNYPPGNELPFIKDAVELLDNIWATDGVQYLIHSKTKYAHSSPMVVFEGIEEYEKEYIELADILVVVNFYFGDEVYHRQGFFSQTKCIKNSNKGYATWEVEKTQYRFLNNRPKLQLINKKSSKWFNLSETTNSFLNYSFVGNIHRPFFYTPVDMEEFFYERKHDYRFNYGLNPPSAQRYFLTVLKKLIRWQYGGAFRETDDEYDLIKEIYNVSKLPKSKSKNKMADGGTNGGFGIVEVSVDSGGYFLDRLQDLELREYDQISDGEQDFAGNRIEEVIRSTEIEGPTLY